MKLLEIQDYERKELSKIHDCDACHGKIVCISVDNVGVTRCGYCNAIVDYSPYYNNLYKSEILKLITELRIKNLTKEESKWQKKNLKKKERRRKEKDRQEATQ